MKDLSGRTAAITGAGSGIGRAIALELAERGCKLELADLDEPTVTQVAEATGGFASVVDVANDPAVTAWAAEVQDRGGADILVNNAGITVYSTFAGMDHDDVARLMGVNVFGVLHGCRAFLPQLAERRGHIVTLSSMAGLLGMPMQTTYCASKFAVRGFSAGLRAELAARGVGVTCVLPGTTGTALLAGASGPHPDTTGFMHRSMNRFGVSPTRVARATVRGIRRNRAEVLVGPDARLLRLAVSLAPWLPRWGMRLLFARLAGPGGEPHGREG
jgi:short-subunit dehydrogenase